MGGNKGKRTKGNVRPTNSARIANMFLESMPTNQVTFSTFNTRTDNMDDISEIDHEISTVIKKLSKKCIQTRLNALKELENLFDARDETSFVAITPMWTRAFSKLSTDENDEIRLMCIKVHSKLVQKAGRQLAPFLKNILWPWLVLMYDHSPNVRPAACETFNNLFNEEKQIRLFELRKDDLLEQILESFTTAFPAATSQDMTHLHVACSAIQVLQSLLEKMPNDEKLDSHFKLLFTIDRFWSFSLHPYFPLQLAWFNLINAIVRVRPELLANHCNRLINTIISFLDKYTSKSTTHQPVSTINCVWFLIVRWLTVQDRLPFPSNRVNTLFNQICKIFETPDKIPIILLQNLVKLIHYLSTLTKNNGQNASEISKKIIYAYSKGLCSVSLFTADFEILFATFFNTLVTMLEDPNQFNLSLPQVFNIITRCLNYLLPVRSLDRQFKVQHSFVFNFKKFVEFLYPKMPNTALVSPVTLFIEKTMKSNRNYNEFNVWLQFLFQSPSEFNLLDVKNNNNILSQHITIEKDKLDDYRWIINQVKENVFTRINFNDTYEFWLVIRRLIDIGTQLEHIFNEEQINTLKEHIIFLLPTTNDDKFVALLVSCYLLLIASNLLPASQLTAILQLDNERTFRATIKQLFVITSASLNEYVIANINDMTSWVIRRCIFKKDDEIIVNSYEIDLWIRFLDHFGYLDILFSYIEMLEPDLQVPMLVQIVRYMPTKLLNKSDTIDLIVIWLNEYFETQEITEMHTTFLVELFFMLVQIRRNSNCCLLSKIFEQIQTALDDVHLNESVCKKIENRLHDMLEDEPALAIVMIELILKLNKEMQTFSHNLIWIHWLDAFIFVDMFDPGFTLNSMDVRIPKPMLAFNLNQRLLIMYLQLDKKKVQKSLIDDYLCILCPMIGFLQTLKYLIPMQRCTEEKLLVQMNLLENVQLYCDRLQKLISIQDMQRMMQLCGVPSPNQLWFLMGLKHIMNNANIQPLTWVHNERSLGFNHFFLFANQYEPHYIQKCFEELMKNVLLFNFNRRLTTEQVKDLFAFAGILSANQFAYDQRIDLLLNRMASVNWMNLLKCEPANVFNVLPFIQKLITEYLPHFSDSHFPLIFDLSDCANEFWQNLNINSYNHYDLGLMVRFNQLIILINDQLPKTHAQQYQTWIEHKITHLYRTEFTHFINLNKELIPINMERSVRAMCEFLSKVDCNCLMDLKLQVSNFIETRPIQMAVEYILLDNPLDNLMQYLVDMLKHNFMDRSVAFQLSLKYLQNNASQLKVTNLLESDEDAPVQPPNWLLEPLQCFDSTLNLMLKDYPLVQVHCEFVSASDSQNIVLTYLLFWRLYLQMHDLLPIEQKIRTLNLIGSLGLLDNLFANLFRLIPLQFDFASKAEFKLDRDQIKQWFETPFDCPVTQFAGKYQVEHAACDLYTQVLRQIPSSIRLWLQRQSGPVMRHAMEIARLFVSPKLIAEEMERVKQEASQINPSLKLRTRTAAQEVLATYQIEEASIELCFKLTPNFPLERTNIDCGKRVGVDANTWRTWSLQLTAFLDQNGSVCDGIKLWARNLSRRFEGVDECMICFYVLHILNQQLPRVSCRNCRKKFHSLCLNKWFSTSQNRTCPLCRSEFA